MGTVTRILIFLSVGAMAWGQAQSSAQIQGTVQDSSGAAVPSADLKLTQTATGVVRTATTGVDGTYVVPNLPIGPYRLEVSKTGFSTAVQTGIVLQVATNPTIDVTLKVGAVSDQVQVEANGVLVETQATGIGNVIENQRIVELPLNGRLATDLIPLVGGTIPQGQAGSAGFPNTVNIVVAGGQAYGNAFWLDGSLYTDPYMATNMPFPFPDALQEFKVETSALTAQNGVKSGASITAVTKSGTNSLHGDVFEFLRNGDFNARNFFATRRDTLKRNQFGGTVGGPIRKDKLFFFGGYQGTITRQDPTGIVAFVPTPAMVGGDFSACPQDIPAALKAQFPGNKISPTLYNSSSLLLAKKLPVSNDPCGRVTFGEVTRSNEIQVLGRVDYQASDKSSLFFRYMATTFRQPASLSLTPDEILSSGQGGYDNLAQTAILGHTYLISPSTVNAFRASFSREAIDRFNADYFSGCDLGVQMYCGYLPHQSSFAVTGAFTIGGNTAKAINRLSLYQLSDDVSLVRGNHQLGFGITVSDTRDNVRGNVFAEGTFSFASLPQFLLGTLNSFSDSAPNAIPVNKNYLGMYAQDTWKISPRLTANLGVRWDPFFPFQLTNGAVYNFDLANFIAGKKTQVYANAAPGFTYPGDPGFPGGKGGMNKQWNSFAPRIGLAWDPKGDGRMTIRASYGIAYDFAAGEMFANEANAPPFGNTVTISGSPFNNPFATNPGGNIFPFTVNKNVPFVPFGTYIAMQPNMKTTEVHLWNLTLQKQVGTDWLFSAAYIGSETEHLWYTYQTNPSQIVPCANGVVTSCNTIANRDSRRVLSLAGYPGSKLIGFLDSFADGGTASYNGLLLSARRRLSRGISADANYTWSHCIGDLTTADSTSGAGAGIVNPNNRRADRGNCQSSESGGTFSSDRRQIFNLSVVAQVPQFSNRMLATVVSGWQVAGIYRATTGGYYTVTLPSDVALSSASGQRPQQVLQNPLCQNPNSSCWINPAAFATPAPGTLSTLGKDNIQGPGFWEFDMSLSRTFRIYEHQSLQIRGEAFNLPNSFRAGVAPPSLSAGSPGLALSYPASNFGQITSALDPRILQFSMKYVF